MCLALIVAGHPVSQAQDTPQPSARKSGAWTSPIDRPNSVASLESLTIGGVKQFILIRGEDKSKPILLFLHGGPGMPMMYLAHSFQAWLEKDFVVVQWDQRNAGKSYDPDNIPADTMNVEQFISDTHELTQYLRHRFGAPKIFLVGHSWGSYLGILVAHRYPQLFYAYVGVGQVANSERAVKIQEGFILSQLKATGCTPDQIARFENNPEADRENYLFKFHGELYRSENYSPLVKAGLAAPEYTLRDAFNVAKGPQYAAKHMRYNAISGELMDAIREVNVPVYFMEGRHDYTAPSELAVEYLAKLRAPSRHLVWFENSAHFPFFEEPEEFATHMRAILRETKGR